MSPEGGPSSQKIVTELRFCGPARSRRPSGRLTDFSRRLTRFLRLRMFALALAHTRVGREWSQTPKQFRDASHFERAACGCRNRLALREGQTYGRRCAE